MLGNEAPTSAYLENGGDHANACQREEPHHLTSHVRVGEAPGSDLRPTAPADAARPASTSGTTGASSRSKRCSTGSTGSARGDASRACARKLGESITAARPAALPNPAGQLTGLAGGA